MIVGRVSAIVSCFLMPCLLAQTQQHKASALPEMRVSSYPYFSPSQSTYTLKSETKLVEVDVTVRDHSGKPVEGLGRDDFSILDGGKPRAIAAFTVLEGEHPLPIPVATQHPDQTSHQPSTSPGPSKPVDATRPRYLALMFDDANESGTAAEPSNVGGDQGLLNGLMVAGALQRTQAAAKKLVSEPSVAGVHIGIFTVSGVVQQDFTMDQAKLLAAIKALKVQPASLDSSSNYSVLASVGQVVEHLGRMPGARELLLASPGFLAGSAGEERVINLALRTGVVIDSLSASGVYSEFVYGSRRQDGAVSVSNGDIGQFDSDSEANTINLGYQFAALNDPLAALAKGTGGIFYHGNNDLARGFQELAEPPGVTYELGFRPDDVVPDGSFHKLKVILTNKKTHYPVQARPGYFAPTASAPNPSVLSITGSKTPDGVFQAVIDREILASDTVTNLPIGITVAKNNGVLAVTVKLDITHLHFVKQGDRLTQRIVFTTALLEPDGDILAAKESELTVALTEASYRRLAGTGMSATVKFAVPAGSYRLRQVVEEAVEGKLACATHEIHVTFDPARGSTPN